jgi:hypothetical protein
MSEREDRFELDEDFLAEQQEESSDFDRIVIERVDRRAKQAAVKRGKAAWSRLEDVLADRRLEKELREFYEVDKKGRSRYRGLPVSITPDSSVDGRNAPRGACVGLFTGIAMQERVCRWFPRAVLHGWS